LSRVLEKKESEKRKNAEEIVRKLKSSGFEAYFVGGCVRDFVRGKVPGDYDITTSARPEEVMAVFERSVPIGAKYGVVAVIMSNHNYEVATFRSDDVYEDGRRPKQVHFSTAREDVLRRDFTINGLLMDPVTGEIIDYAGGCADIEKKIIRTIGEPDARFREDYLRMLRAVRFAAYLNYEIEERTVKAIKSNCSRIKQISAERLQEELNKILTREGARQGFELMEKTGMLHQLLPEIERLKGVQQPPRFHPEGDVLQHTLIMLELLRTGKDNQVNPALAWAVLLHDVGKALTKTEDEKGVHFYGHVQRGEGVADDVMKRLRFSRTHREKVINLIHYHMVFMNVDKMRPGRLKRFLRIPDFDLHLELHRLDCMASHGMLDKYEFCREQLNKMAADDLHPPRLLDGNEIIALGYQEGKTIGIILKKLEDEQLEGRIKTKKEAKLFVKNNFKK
jgi:poly(A) polymerase